MTQLANGLSDAGHHEDALSVQEAELATERRLGAPEQKILVVQGNLANTYQMLGRLEEGVRLQRDVYSGWLKLAGEEYRETLREANNYGLYLLRLQRFEDARSVLRRTMPVARRVLGEGDEITLLIRWNYARASYLDDDIRMSELRESVKTLEDTERTARRVLGSAHPYVQTMGESLQEARATLRTGEIIWREQCRSIFGTDSSGDSS